MAISVFDLFTVGIGPSSSHTVGPMRAANRFCARLARDELLDRVERVTVDLYGSLGATGEGHGTDQALLLGLEAERPEQVDPETLPTRVQSIRAACRLRLSGEREIAFRPGRDIRFLPSDRLPLHSNGMAFAAHDRHGRELVRCIYYSIGGGFVVSDEAADEDRLVPDRTSLPHPFRTARELLRLTEERNMPIDRLILANETCWRPVERVRGELLGIWDVMQTCVARALRQEGCLPGRLRLTRRAPRMRAELAKRRDLTEGDSLAALDWVNLYALAVAEENAAGGRVVTAPTNGAAGIIPAVLHYYTRHLHGADDEGVIRFLLTAGAIGILYKQQASVSGAEVGCQGEIGVACSMAAAGLVAALGGSPRQVENAAEIAMEHNLGLTCDPVAGLVQIPCIERNAMGAVKAINAARMAQRGDGTHVVLLDQVIETMRQTGADMKTRYKETSRGGLAITVIEC